MRKNEDEKGTIFYRCSSSYLLRRRLVCAARVLRSTARYTYTFDEKSEKSKEKHVEISIARIHVHVYYAHIHTYVQNKSNFPDNCRAVC